MPGQRHIPCGERDTLLVAMVQLLIRRQAVERCDGLGAKLSETLHAALNGSFEVKSCSHRNVYSTSSSPRSERSECSEMAAAPSI